MHRASVCYDKGVKQTILMQRIEAAFVFAASVFFYYHLGFNFWYFLPVLFAIDVFMAGYLISKQAGAIVYNMGHSFIVPSVLLVAGSLTDSALCIGLGLIWLAHIGMDRALGYGLKYESGFTDTHLGRIGNHGKEVV